MNLEQLQQSDAPPTPPPAPSGGEVSANEQPISLDLGSSSANPLETSETVATKRRIPSGVVLLVVVLVVAGGALYAMRLGGSVSKSDTTASAAEIAIAQALATLGANATAPAADGQTAGKPLETTDEVIARFANDPTGKQVSLDQLSKNPFARAGGAQVTEVGLDEAGPNATPAQQNLRKIRDELSRLQLQTVMNGRVPLAVINGKIVRVGDKFGSFRITAIERMSVVLSAAGKTYHLTMEQPRMGGD